MSKNLYFIAAFCVLSAVSVAIAVGMSYFRFRQLSCKYTELWSENQQSRGIIAIAAGWVLPLFFPVVNLTSQMVDFCFSNRPSFWEWAILVSVPGLVVCARVGKWLYRLLNLVSKKTELCRIARLEQACMLKCRQCRKLAQEHPEDVAGLLAGCTLLDEECPEKFRNISLIMSDKLDPAAVMGKLALQRRKLKESALGQALLASGLVLSEDGVDTWLDFSDEEQQVLAQVFAADVNFANRIQCLADEVRSPKAEIINFNKAVQHRAAR